MSRKSKAWLKASQQMAEAQGYDMTLNHRDMEEWLASQQDQHSDTWDIIWKAARRAEWEKCQEDIDPLQAQITKLMLKLEQTEGNLTQVVQTSKNRGDRIAQLGAVNGNLLAENVRLKKALAEAKLPSNGDRLYDQVERELHHVENALELAEQELASTRVTLLEEREKNRKLGATLEAQNTALNACSKKRNELLVRAVEAEAKLSALESQPMPKIPTKPKGEGWNLSWVRMTGETITGTVTPERPPLAPCTGTMGRHKCDMQTRRGSQHPDRHRCHCGIWWTHGGETGGVG